MLSVAFFFSCVSCTRAHWPVSIICNVFVLLLFAAAAAAYDVVCVTFCRNICARTCCIVCCVWPPVGNPARASVCVRERARASRASVVESASNARAPAHNTRCIGSTACRSLQFRFSLRTVVTEEARRRRCPRRRCPASPSSPSSSSGRDCVKPQCVRVRVCLFCVAGLVRRWRVPATCAIDCNPVFMRRIYIHKCI